MTSARRPQVIALAGPNGAGKSTVGPGLLRGALRVTEFVNADVIAQGLSAFNPEGVAISAGRVMLGRLRELAAQRADFAFETTMAGRTPAIWIRTLLQAGYGFGLVFLWLPSPDMALERVRARVQVGGHKVPEPVVRRRYSAGLRNFFHVYRPLATTWRFYDNSWASGPRLVAMSAKAGGITIRDQTIWEGVAEKWAR